MTKIWSSAFQGCYGLSSIVIPDSVREIGNEAFLGCTSLTSFVIGKSVKVIGDRAFFGCTGLKNIIVPSSVIEIGDYVFPNNTQISFEPGSSLSLRLTKMDSEELNDLIERANFQWAYTTCMYILYDQNDHEDEEEPPFLWEETTETTGILHVEMYPPTNGDIIEIMEEMIEDPESYDIKQKTETNINIYDELKAHNITDVVDLDAINQYILRFFHPRNRETYYYFTSADVTKGEFKYRYIS